MFSDYFTTPLGTLAKRIAIALLVLTPFALLGMLLLEHGKHLGPEWAAVRLLAAIGTVLIAVSWEARAEYVWRIARPYVWSTYLAVCVITGLVVSTAMQFRSLFESF
jgi:hypothetical protein